VWLDKQSVQLVTLLHNTDTVVVADEYDAAAADVKSKKIRKKK
jgi:hypothetical protein